MTVIDFPAQLAATDREVLVHTDEGVEMRTVVLRQTYPTPVEDLWEACTTADRLARWFQPVTGDLTLGGRYQVEGNAGGTIQQCDAPRFLRVTWEFGDGRSWVELHLAPAGDSSRLELRHITPMNDFWVQYGPGAVGVGWDLSFLGLALYLPTGEALDRAAVEAATMSPAGLEFIRGSATAWGEAAIMAGEDAHVARTAVINTAAFYTGTEAGS
jgi:uncharacterized protein YndB with AHSA1/START domain